MHLIPHLVELGGKIEICVIRSRGDLADRVESELGVRVHECRVDGRLQPSSIRSLAAFFRNRSYDVVHSHMYQSNVPATVAAQWAGVPGILAQWHNINTYENVRQRLTDRALMPLRGRLLCVSEAVAADTARALWMNPRRFHVVRNGICPHEIVPSASAWSLRGDLNLLPGSFVIAHIARLHQNKNHSEFLSCFPSILRQVPQAVLLIVGEGRERLRLEAQARELGVAGRVQFLGNRHDVPRLLAAADVSVLPSTREGFSNVVLESMVAGAVVVATDVGGIREQIDDGAEGFIVPPGDMESFAKRIVRLADDPVLRNRMAARARDRVAAFDIRAMAAETMRHYVEVLSRASSKFHLRLPRMEPAPREGS